MAKVSVVGAGYVGVCTGLAFAEHGHEVTLVDVDVRRLEGIMRGEPPFFEPGLAPLLKKHVLSGRIRTAGSFETHAPGDFVFLCVGTPAASDGRMDLRYIRAAAADVGSAIRRHGVRPVVITKSTVLPGTTRDVVAPTLAEASGLAVGVAIHVAAVPEFLKEGAAVHDALHPDRIVVGADDPETARKVWTLFEGHECARVNVDIPTAEMTKYAANAFLAAKVALSNELANVAAKVGVDWYAVSEGIGLDPRIGPLFLRAGAGFGGSCFPKDVSALSNLGADVGARSPILDAVLESNDRQPLVVVDLLQEELGVLAGKRVALLGLAFKPDTDDVRETRALPIYEALRKAGADVVVHDPEAAGNFARMVPGCTIAKSPEEALEGADGCVLQTEWKRYRDLAPQEFLSRMRAPVVVDGRRTFDPTRMRSAGVRYRAIGLGKHAGR